MPNRVPPARPRRTSSDRIIDNRDVKERFLIICEGEKTEPNYFRSFRVPGRVLDIQGTGMNTLSLVDETIRLKQEKEAELAFSGYDSFDQVWCVFDRDSFPSGNFNNAISKARANGFRIAFTNEAFELWYLLHFAYYDAALSRDDYKARLSSLLGHRYEKNSLDMYDNLIARQADAIRNAVALYRSYSDNNPEQNNPVTTVHTIVIELNRSVGA